MVNVTLAKVDKRLTEIVDDERWIEIRNSLKDLQTKIDSTQLTIEDYNSMQKQLTQMVGNEEDFSNMWIEAFFEESEIINDYASENSLDSLIVTISDVVGAGYLFRGVPISGVSNEFRNLAHEIRDKDMNEILPSFLDMRGDVNGIGNKVNDIYGGETISVCQDECTPEGAKESMAGGERECYDSNQDSCLEWVETCDGVTGESMRYSDEQEKCVSAFSVNANPNPINSGESSVLSWSSGIYDLNSASCKISETRWNSIRTSSTEVEIGISDTKSFSVSPTETIQYIITCEGTTDIVGWMQKGFITVNVN